MQKHFIFLPLMVFLALFAPSTAQSQGGVDQTIWSAMPTPQVNKPEEQITDSDLQNAIRAGRPQYVDTRAKIVEMLKKVKEGKMGPETFYVEVSKLDMPPGKEVRHTLMEVKKDIGNYLGKEGLKDVFGKIFDSGATKVEAQILTHRKKVVMHTIKRAIVAYREKVKAATGEYPKFSFYYGEVGGWPNETFEELKFAGDIDFNFLAGDLDAAMELKKIFDQLIIERYGRTPEELDIPCTVHGMATAEVYVGKHGQSFAEDVTKVAWEIDFENATDSMDLKAKEVPFSEVLENMVMEARMHKANNSIDDLQTLKWPYQPGISLEMIRHFEHDIAGQDVFTDLESFVKAAKYTDRGYTFLEKELGEKAKMDPVLKKLVGDLTEHKKNPKKQVELIKDYFQSIGKPVPFEVNLEINADGKGRATLEANKKIIEDFWGICRKALWDGANQVLKAKTDDLKRRVAALGEDDLEASKKIYEDLVKLDEMLEIEDRVLNDDVAGLHGELDPEYKNLMGEFRKMRSEYKRKSAKFGHVEYTDPKLGKTYTWIEEMLKLGKPDNIKWAAGALFKAPGKFNDALDFIDDGLMTKLRSGEGEDYIKILRKGQGLYWDEQVNQFLKGTPWEGKYTAKHTETHAEFLRSVYPKQLEQISQSLTKGYEKILATRGLKLVRSAGGATLGGIQTFNNNFNEGLSSVPEGRALGGAMMLYSLSEELPLYADLMSKADYKGLAAEFFKRRIPFGGAVEREVMGDHYGAAWEVVTTMIPPTGMFKAAWGVGESIATTSIDAFFDEEMELFIDNLYEEAEFDMGTVEKVGEDIKIASWTLKSVTYSGKKFDYQELIALEMEGAREMADCLQKPTAERPACFPVDKMGDGLFEWWRNREAFEHAFKKSDSWIQLISEMEKHPSVGPKLKEHFRYQKWTRYEQIKVVFLKEVKRKLEERKAGDETLISGQFAKAYEELLKIAEDLDIRVQIEEKISEEFGGEVVQFLTWMKDYMRGVARSWTGEVDVWDIYEELSAFVTKNLTIYKNVLDSRSKMESQLVQSEDMGLRVLTGPYFLDGDGDKDKSNAKKWESFPKESREKMSAQMASVKEEAGADPAELDLTEGSYDAGVLKELTFHESFIEFWIQANKRIGFLRMPSFLGNPGARQERPNAEGGVNDGDLATKQFAYHGKRVDEILEEFRQHYESQEDQEEDEAQGEDDVTLASLEGVLGRLNALYEEVKAKKKDYKSQARIFGKEVDALEDKFKVLTDRIAAEIPAETVLTAGEPQRIFDEMRTLGEKLARLRDEIEKVAYGVCQQYEIIKKQTDVKGVDATLEEGRAQFREVERIYKQAQQVIKRLDELKVKITSLADTPELLALADQFIAEGKSLITEGKVLNEKGGVLQKEILTLEKYTGLAAAVVAEADQTMADLKPLPEESDKEVKKARKALERIYKSIKSAEKKVNKVAASAQDISGKMDGDIANALSFGQQFEPTLEQLVKRAGSSANAELDAMKKEISAMYDATMLFADPIEEAYKNAQTCLDGVVDRNAQVATPQARVAAADCSKFPGTFPQWDAADQVVRCNCEEGFVWAQAKKRCIDRKENEIANLNCSQYPNTQGVWSETMQRAICDCIGNYAWNGNNTACTPPVSEQMANTNCSHLGPYSEKVWDGNAGIVRCGCRAGYSQMNGRCVSQYEIDRQRQQQQAAQERQRRERRERNRQGLQDFLQGVTAVVNEVQRAQGGTTHTPPSINTGTGYSSGTSRSSSSGNCAYDYSMGSSGKYGNITFKCNCSGWGFDPSRSQCVQGMADRYTGQGSGSGGSGYTGGGSSNTGITTNRSRSQGAGSGTTSSSGSSGGYGYGGYECKDDGNRTNCYWAIGDGAIFGIGGGDPYAYCACGSCSTPVDKKYCAGKTKPAGY